MASKRIDTMAESRAGTIVINRWLPYWAVLQADFGQVLSGWVWRAWVGVCLLATACWLVYRLGAHREAGLVQEASVFLTDLVRWILMGSVGLVVILAAGAISSERGTLADSILSRGISRRQYYLGKFHARLGAVLCGFFLVSIFATILGQFFLKEDLDFKGCLLATWEVGMLLAALVSIGVMLSSILNNTLVSIMALWFSLYGGGAILSLVPGLVPQLHLVWNRIPYVIKGHYSLVALGEITLFSLIVCTVTSLFGMMYFSRRDV